MPQAAIGLKIRDRRKRLGIAQIELADRLGISASYLNLIERNKRNISARLLQGLADNLQVDVDWLDGRDEQRVVQELDEMTTDPVLRDIKLDASSAADMVARNPDWANAMVALYRAYVNRNQTVAALSDRLNQDPYLGDAVHSMLTKITTIRSTADILNSMPDLNATDRQRFQTMLAQESTALSGIAEGIAQFFDTADTEAASLTPDEEVDDFFLDSSNYFHDLELAAEILGQEISPSGSPSDTQLIEYLQSRLGVSVRFVREEDARVEELWNQVGYSSSSRSFNILESAQGTRYRFQLMRLVCRLALASQISGIVEQSSLLRSAEARKRAAGAIASYAAASILMPYGAFHRDAEQSRYDIEFLARKYAASYEQVCHRLVSLRRQGLEGVPFAFMRTDQAGFITKRMPLPRLQLPRYGNACPLWAVYNAFQTQGTISRQIAEFPNGERFMFIARAQGKVQTRFNTPQHLVSVMIGCDILYADRTIYADGLTLGTGGMTTPVGPSCRLCARTACMYREEAPIFEMDRDTV